jgi:Tol biopolymer transport system component
MERAFTFDPSEDAAPMWSPDGSRIVFASAKLGPYNLFQKTASGAANEELLQKSNYFNFPSDWSPDGQVILYEELNPKTRTDLWILPMSGERKPIPFLNTQFNESQARFSPDGQRIAYVSDETGHPEVML